MIQNTALLIDEEDSLGVAIVPGDNMPLYQVYDSESSAYIPDFTLLPLTLDAIVTQGGTELTELTERGWYEINADGSMTQIKSTTAGYALYPTGHPNGIQIKKNLPTGTRLALYFRAKSGSNIGMATITVRSESASGPMPSLEIDAPAQMLWNPYDDEKYDVLTITPRVNSRGMKTELVWKKIEDGLKRDLLVAGIGGLTKTDPKDIELSLDTATMALSVDRRWMGKQIQIVCELYLVNGTTKTMIRQRPVTIRRVIPSYNISMSAVRTFSKDVKQIYAKAIVSMPSAGGPLANPEKELLLSWYEDKTKVGEGIDHTFNTAGGTKQSVKMGLDHADRGPMCLFVDSDGKYLVDSDGKYLGGR